MTDSPYATFWSWFLTNEEKLFQFENQEEVVLDETLNALQQINDELVFEIGPAIGGLREFVVSANGAKTAFADVIEIVKSAPELDRWIVVPFRQRKNVFDMEIEIDDTVVTPQDFRFSFDREKGRIDLSIFVEGMDPDAEDTFHLVFLLLDTTIGEYDVEMKIGSIGIYDESEIGNDEVVYPLTKLPHVVDSLSITSVH